MVKALMSIRRMLPVPIIGILGLVISISGILEPLELKLDELRMSWSPKPASGDVVYVAIDAKSLQEIGVWPWPRHVHAAIIDRLTEAGARDVFLDIDFAFAGDPDDDAALVDALERAGGSVYLAAFSQASSGTSDAAAEVSSNLPDEAFAAVSWPALVNVPVDPDGLIRRAAFVSPLRDAATRKSPTVMSVRVIATVIPAPSQRP